MKLNTRTLDDYVRDIAATKEAIESAKHKLDFLRLQAKQTREMIKLAKTHKELRAFVQAIPEGAVDVEPSPGKIYASVTLSCLNAATYRNVPESLGLELVATQPTHPDSIASPILRTYRSTDKRVSFYITENVVR